LPLILGQPPVADTPSLSPYLVDEREAVMFGEVEGRDDVCEGLRDLKGVDLSKGATTGLTDAISHGR
jgi:hypothetical protein